MRPLIRQLVRGYGNAQADERFGAGENTIVLVEQAYSRMLGNNRLQS